VSEGDPPPDRAIEHDGRFGRVRPYLKPVAYLVVAAAALYLLLPGLVSVFSSWRSLEHLDWPFAVLALILEIASWVCLWNLDRIALGVSGWFAVACAQLAGNALGRIVPGSATPSTVVMLRRAGLDGGDAAAALTASTLLQIGTALALPLLAVPAILTGAPVDRGLETAALLGLAVVILLIAVGAVLLTTEAPLRWVGRVAQSLINATFRRRHPLQGVADELVSDRDFIVMTIGRRWRAALVSAVGNTAFDYLALLCALRAVGASPRPSLVMFAYASAELLAQVPLTPGGLGFVEAGLVGTLTLAGVPGPAALAATLLYRLVSYWLPLPLGGLAYLAFRRRYGTAYRTGV
jgi:putative heme transporter